MRRLFGCPDIVSLTEKFLMARNVFQIFTENNPVRGSGKIYNRREGVKKRTSQMHWNQIGSTRVGLAIVYPMHSLACCTVLVRRK